MKNTDKGLKNTSYTSLDSELASRKMFLKDFGAGKKLELLFNILILTLRYWDFFEILLRSANMHTKHKHFSIYAKKLRSYIHLLLNSMSLVLFHKTLLIFYKFYNTFHLLQSTIKSWQHFDFPNYLILYKS